MISITKDGFLLSEKRKIYQKNKIKNVKQILNLQLNSNKFKKNQNIRIQLRYYFKTYNGLNIQILNYIHVKKNAYGQMPRLELDDK